MHNTKEFPIGSVVYFVKIDEFGNQTVQFGIVEENFPGTICLDLYTVNKMRKINGVLEKDLITPTKWQKLPKGWSYDTRLIKVENADIFTKEQKEEFKQFRMDNPNDILKAIKDGILVKYSELDQSYYDTEIDSKQGWRIIRRYDKYYDWTYGYSSIDWRKAHHTYAGAQKEIDDYYAELKRQANLSDLEWSIEQIDYVLDNWEKGYHIEESLKQKYRDWIMQRDRLEDIEIRACMRKLQWKYCDRKKWHEIEI